MGDNKLITWSALALFALAVTLTVVVILLPAIGCYEVVSPGAALWVVGALDLLTSATGPPAFERPQGKVAVTGGLLLFIAIVWVTPASVQVLPGRPTRPE